MIRLFIVVVVGLSLSGCVSTFKSTGASRNSGTPSFSLALQKLADEGDLSALKTLAENKPNSAQGENAKLLLSHQAKQSKKIKSLQVSNKKLKDENRQLKETLEKLNRINLEMEKR